MGDNTKIVLLEKRLVDTLNESSLPILVKKMVLENVLRTATEAAEQKLKEEAMESKEGEENGIQ
ncbi:MAG: hypothetical protein IIT42_03360 [Clostridia bacterium]|nr:hypothetical protein [Clostridia bacterium]